MAESGSRSRAQAAHSDEILPLAHREQQQEQHEHHGISANAHIQRPGGNARIGIQSGLDFGIALVVIHEQGGIARFLSQLPEFLRCAVFQNVAAVDARALQAYGLLVGGVLGYQDGIGGDAVVAAFVPGIFVAVKAHDGVSLRLAQAQIAGIESRTGVCGFQGQNNTGIVHSPLARDVGIVAVGIQGDGVPQLQAV